MSYLRALGSWLWKAVLAILAVLGALEGLKQLKLFTWAIPDWILLGLILLTLAIALHTTVWIIRYGQSRELPAVPKREKLKPNIEHMFILHHLANSKSQAAKRGVLLDGYRTVFEGRVIADFNVVYDQLRNREYIGACGNDPHDECVITSEGLLLYREHLDAFRGGDGIPEIPPEIVETYELAEKF